MGEPVDVDALRAVGLGAGLAAVGVARAEPFESTRHDLETRRAAGLAAGMGFTYRDPERSCDPRRLLRNARSLVVGAHGYRRRPPDGAAPAAACGRVAGYVWEDHYAALARALGAIADRLRAAGWRAAVYADQNGLVDREAAYRAGIGWYGKSSNLLLPGRGSWFVLGSVVTDAELPPDRPVEDGCGSCRRCLDGCPTGAIVAPGVVDARRCLAWLVQAPAPFPREHRVALGDRIYGCDDCQEVCPPNRSADRDRPAPTTGGSPWVPLLELLAATDDELLARHGRWYVADRQPRWLRRNALVALGNVGDPASPAVRTCLRRHLASGDAMLRAHAVWAARRLGHDDLLAAVLDDPDEEVRAELAEGVPVRRSGANRSRVDRSPVADGPGHRAPVRLLATAAPAAPEGPR
jgi:epoxyqueuosine reductase